jgi:TPR repeat protein
MVALAYLMMAALDNHKYSLLFLIRTSLILIVDVIQALAYLMMAALDNHRLSFLAIGNKHKHGLDTLPLDLDQAYSKYQILYFFRQKPFWLKLHG